MSAIRNHHRSADEIHIGSRRSILLKRIGLAAVVSFLLVGWLAWGAELGMVHPWLVGLTFAFVCICACIATAGVALQWPSMSDPDRVTGQLYTCAGGCILVNAAIMPFSARPSIGFFLVIAFAFAAFGGRRALVTRLVVITVLLAIVVTLCYPWLSTLLPDNEMGVVPESLYAIAWQTAPFALSMVALALYAGRLSSVRRKRDESRMLTRATLDALPDAVIQVDRAGIVTAINQNGLSLLNMPRQAVEDRPLSELLSFRQGDNPVSHIMLLPELSWPALAESAGPLMLRNEFLLNSGQKTIPVKSVTIQVTDPTGHPLGYLVTIRDVSMEQELISRLEFESTHDCLTGLLNRHGFELEAEEVCNRLRRPNSRELFGLAIVDMDNLKFINDLCGHAAGDQLISACAHVMEQIFPDAHIARLGGDEFAILTRLKRSNDLERLMTELTTKMREIEFEYEGRQFPVSVTVGCVPLKARNIEFSAALSAADAALYSAKEACKGGFKIADQGAAIASDREADLEKVAMIQDALRLNQFELFAQEVKPTQGFQKTYYEVLIRLKRGDEYLSPAAFLPAAERFNLMPQIDLWVLECALKRLQHLRDQNRPLPRLAVNLSGQTVQHPAAADAVRKALSSFPGVGKHISFELTETVAIHSPERARAFMDSVREFGCEFALDDVGAGFSSLGTLEELQFERIKIDGYYIKGFSQKTANRLMVNNLIKIGTSLGIQVVAEMVEDEAIANELSLMGVCYLQGYLFHRPEPLDALLLRTTHEFPAAAPDWQERSATLETLH